MSATKQTKNHAPDDHAELRKQLIALLHGGQAHATFDDAVKEFPAHLRGTVPPAPPSATSSTSRPRPPAVTTLPSGPTITGPNHQRRQPRSPGTNPSPPSTATSRNSSLSSKIQTQISSSPSAGATARIFSAKLFSSPTTPPTISANSSSFADSSEPGTSKLLLSSVSKDRHAKHLTKREK